MVANNEKKSSDREEIAETKALKDEELESVTGGSAAGAGAGIGGGNGGTVDTITINGGRLSS